MKKSFNLIKNLVLSLCLLVAVSSVTLVQAKGGGHSHGFGKHTAIKSSSKNNSWFFNMKKYLIKQPRQGK